MWRRAVLGGVLLAAYVGALRLTGAAQGTQGGRSRVRDWAQDSVMKITEPFSFASVGDVIITRPASQSTDPGLQFTPPATFIQSVMAGAAVNAGRNLECVVRR